MARSGTWPIFLCPQIMTVCPVTVILDTGSCLTTTSARVAGRSPHRADGGLTASRVADGGVHHVTENSCPMTVDFHTCWGAVTLEAFSFAVVPGTDYAIILGNPTLKYLGIEIHDRLGE